MSKLINATIFFGSATLYAALITYCLFCGKVGM